jgi:hypothetical protein
VNELLPGVIRSRWKVKTISQKSRFETPNFGRLWSICVASFFWFEWDSADEWFHERI